MAKTYSSSKGPKPKRRRDRKNDLSGGDLASDGGSLTTDQGSTNATGEPCTTANGAPGRMKGGKCVATKEEPRALLVRLMDLIAPEGGAGCATEVRKSAETLNGAEPPGLPWEYFTLDPEGPLYFDEGFPEGADPGGVEGYAVVATDSDGEVHARALDGERDEILTNAARLSGAEGSFVTVSRAMGLFEGETVWREIATFRPEGDEVEVNLDDLHPETREKQVRVAKTDDDLQIAYGEVYAPIPFPDSHGDVMTAEGIRQMAHKFLASGRVNKIDTRHDNVETGAVVVESFIAEEGSGYIPGAWVVGVHIPNKDLWLRVKSGELNGFSMQSLVFVREKQIELDVPSKIEGMTEEAEGHRHTYSVRFSDDGEFLGGSTDLVDGHIHDIESTSITARAGEGDHRHRYSFLSEIFGG